MELVKLTHDNIEQEHICCAIANNRDIQVMSKKNWLKERLDEGLVFLKGDVRGKCFIEYIPDEYAWVPIEAEGYMYIDCLWVSGKYKGHGYSNLLLDRCIEDSKKNGKKGLVILSSNKKKGFLSDSKYMKYKGFESVDTAEPYFELMYLPFDQHAEKPHFRSAVHEHGNMPKGFVLYYTNQCPFTAKYVPLFQEMAKTRGIATHVVHIQSREEAQNAPTAFTTYSLFYDGKFLTHEILSENKFEKILVDKGL
ncbi:MAG: GNAT family N-acetyltransferase [Lachnospiraceae bacterium]|nr:GNAT family N-acetyltransferase [Lachnospiraceae bacterium]